MNENDKTGYTYETSQLGRMLKRQREAMGISQAEMAKRLGVCRQTIIKLEARDADEKIQPILEAYGFEIRPKPINYNAKPYELRPITREDLEAAQRIESIIQRALGEQQRG